MGRGRAKAKQTKVARELKYRPIGTDLNALRAELSGTGRSADTRAPAPEADDKDVDDDDPYAAYVLDDDDEDDEDPAVDRWVAPH